MKSFRVVFLPCVWALAIAMTMPAGGQNPQVKFALPVGYNAGPITNSAAAADLRGVGKVDLVVADYCETVNQPDSCAQNGEGGFSVLLGNGDGTFQAAVTYPTGAYSANSVAIGDVNGDGIPDLVVANACQKASCSESADGAVSVLLGNGDGTFQPAVVYSSGDYLTYSVALADLRGNGVLDIVVTNTYYGELQYEGSVSVLLGNGDGTFQPAVSYGSGAYIAASAAIGDANGDGIPDLIVANFCYASGCGTGTARDGKVGVLLGNGDGTFQPAVLYDSGGEFADSIAIAHLRGNGVLDVVVANRYGDDESKHSTVDVLLGNGDGTFQPAVSYVAKGISYPSYPAIGPGINSLAIADVNGDGIPDVVVVEECQTIQYYTDCVGNKELNVFLGNGDGTFQVPVVYSSGGFDGSALAIADVNRDGRPDILVTNTEANEGDYLNGSVAILLNKTSYTTTTALASSPNPALINQTVTFTATITSNPPVPNGEIVTFSQGTTKLGTGTTTNGLASLTTSFSKAKNYYTIKAHYPGDAFRKPSSGTVMQVVNP